MQTIVVEVPKSDAARVMGLKYGGIRGVLPDGTVIKSRVSTAREEEEAKRLTYKHLAGQPSGYMLLWVFDVAYPPELSPAFQVRLRDVNTFIFSKVAFHNVGGLWVRVYPMKKE